MKRFYVLFSMLVLGVVIVAGTLSLRRTQAQDMAGTPEEQAKQAALEKATPKLAVTEDWLPAITPPPFTLGEVEGVSMNSQGHLFVYSRSGTGGSARGGTAAQLFEFDQANKFVKVWGQGNYAASFAHSVRVDKKTDDVFMVDEGSGMVVKWDKDAHFLLAYGRKDEAIDYLERFLERGEHLTTPAQIHPVGQMGVFNRPTDVTWDSKGNIYVSDGYGNSRVNKITAGGHWLKSVGTFGSGVDQFVIPHTIASDRSDRIFVGDRNNRRIKVFDTDLNLKATWTGMASPWGICVTPGTPQYLYSGDGTTGKIYKIDMTGKVLGWAQTSLGHGEDDAGRLIHEIHCETNNVVYKGSAILWQVDKLTFK